MPVMTVHHTPAAGRESVYHYDYRRARDLGYARARPSRWRSKADSKNQREHSMATNSSQWAP
jgi:hypothetical protein